MYKADITRASIYKKESRKIYIQFLDRSILTPFDLVLSYALRVISRTAIKVKVSSGRIKVGTRTYTITCASSRIELFINNIYLK